jgi:hypothetical protein
VISLEERRALLLRRNELAVLTELPNWIVLSAVVEEEIEKIKRAMMGAMLGRGMTIEEQAFMRGRIVGLRAARSIPEHARAKELTESSPRDEEVAAGE